MSRHLALIAALLVLAGCRATGADPEPLTSPSVAPVDGRVPFHVHLGAGQRLIVNPPGTDDCPAVSARIVLGDDKLVLLTAHGPACGTRDNDSPGNGRHGVYRTSDDIPPGRTTTTAATPLGEATLFTQPYYECTNSCNHYAEPVAVIALAGPDIRALTVVGERGTVDLAALTTLIRDQLTP